MIKNDRWKYIHAPGYAPLLFDLESDPDEFVDSGSSLMRSRRCASADALRFGRLVAAVPPARDGVGGNAQAQMVGLEDKFGVLIGYWDEERRQTAGDRAGLSQPAQKRIKRPLIIYSI